MGLYLYKISKMFYSIIYLFIYLFSPSIQKTEKKEITFLSSDQLLVTADLYQGKNFSKTILLCHQAEYSRGEYTEIAPELVKLGFTCLAIDQRSGKECNGIKNKTFEEAKSKKLKTNFIESEKDIEAAIDYLSQRFQQPVIVWGSSYSASLAIKLATQNKKVRAVIAFSPGEYFSEQFSIRDFCTNLKQPIFITGSKNEMKELKDYLSDSPSKYKKIYEPSSIGDHGSKVLWKSNQFNGEYWLALKEFLMAMQKF